MNNRKYIMPKWESVQDLCKNRMLYRKIDKFYIFVTDNVSRDARF